MRSQPATRQPSELLWRRAAARLSASKLHRSGRRHAGRAPPSPHTSTSLAAARRLRPPAVLRCTLAERAALASYPPAIRTALAARGGSPQGEQAPSIGPTARRPRSSQEKYLARRRPPREATGCASLYARQARSLSQLPASHQNRFGGARRLGSARANFIDRADGTPAALHTSTSLAAARRLRPPAVLRCTLAERAVSAS